MGDAGVLVRPLEFQHAIDIDGRFVGLRFFRIHADDDAGRVHLIDDPAAFRSDGDAGIPRHGRFHARADQRRVGLHQGHGLPLHVRAHQRAVGVIVLQERDQRRGDRNQLFRRHVHQIDLIMTRHLVIPARPARDQFVDEAIAVIEQRVGLGDGVPPLLHR